MTSFDEKIHSKRNSNTLHLKSFDKNRISIGLTFVLVYVVRVIYKVGTRLLGTKVYVVVEKL